VRRGRHADGQRRGGSRSAGLVLNMWGGAGSWQARELGGEAKTAATVAPLFLAEEEEERVRQGWFWDFPKSQGPN